MPQHLRIRRAPCTLGATEPVPGQGSSRQGMSGSCLDLLVARRKRHGSNGVPSAISAAAVTVDRNPCRRTDGLSWGLRPHRIRQPPGAGLQPSTALPAGHWIPTCGMTAGILGRNRPTSATAVPLDQASVLHTIWPSTATARPPTQTRKLARPCA